MAFQPITGAFEAENVVFEVESIDRMYLNVYVPGLQYASGVVGYVHRRLNLPIASTAPLAKIFDRFTRDVHPFAQTHQVPWVDFTKGQRKDRGANACADVGRRDQRNNVSTNLFHLDAHAPKR